MSTAPLRLAVIGAGAHARALLIPALHLTPGLQLVALATGRAESAAAVRAQFGLPTEAGHDALLQRTDVEAVFFLVPGGFRGDLRVVLDEGGASDQSESDQSESNGTNPNGAAPVVASLVSSRLIRRNVAIRTSPRPDVRTFTFASAGATLPPVHPG